MSDAKRLKKSLLDELLLILLINDRLEYLKFWNRTVKLYGHELFKEVQSKALAELKRGH